jgi:hypothetical protein
MFNFEQCKTDRVDLKTVDGSAFDKMLQTNQGCRLTGHIDVNKVAGSFHVAPGFYVPQAGVHSHGHTHQLKASHYGKLNASHIIETLHFGIDVYPNQINALDKASQTAMDTATSMTYSYFMKIVPTMYEYEDGTLINNTFQYSVTKSSKSVAVAEGGDSLPGVVFHYELSPIMVKFIEKRRSTIHFLTSCCAIIGGIFTVAGLLDAFLFKYRNLYTRSDKLT